MADMSETIEALAAALAEAQSELGHAAKDAKNPHFRSDYATLAAVLDATRPVLAKHGLSVLQPAGNDETGSVVVETVLLHKSGQWMRSRLACRPQKADAQGMGSVITYLRRYSLAAMIGISQADDDGEAASGRGGQAKDANPPMEPARQQRRAPADRAPRQAPPPEKWWSNESLAVAAKGDEEFARKFEAAAQNAPTPEAVGKLVSDNEERLNSHQDVDRLLHTADVRRHFLAQAPEDKKAA